MLNLKKEHFVLIGYVVLCGIFVEFAAWILVLVASDIFARAFSFSEIDYWTLRLTFNLINYFVVFVFFVAMFSVISKRNAFVFAIPISISGFLIFFVELGGFECLGRCGLPLWYDVAGFIKYPIYAALGGCLANAFNIKSRRRVQE